jgi:5'-nucleotidase
MQPGSFKAQRGLRILVTNDDGIGAPGLWRLAETLCELGQVMVVAPDRDQSGIGTARTLLEVVRVHEAVSRIEGVPAYAVQGTPADCVILATETLSVEPFDLVVSGINAGSNLGLDIFDSGTVGAALQGYFRGKPSIAVSVASLTDVLFDVAARVVLGLAEAIAANEGLRKPMVFNVNVPNLESRQIEGAEITRLGPRAYQESVEQGQVGQRTHYWIRHNQPTGEDAEEGTDIWAVRNNRISITPFDPSSISGHGNQDLSQTASKLPDTIATFPLNDRLNDIS